MCALMEPTLTMAPPPFCAIHAAVTTLGSHTPLRLVVMTSSYSSSVTSRAGRCTQVPALLTSTSKRPNVSVVRATAASTSERAVTSRRRPRVRRPVEAAISAAAVTHAASSRAATTTSAPASASACAKPRPRPL